MESKQEGGRGGYNEQGLCVTNVMQDKIHG